MWKLWEDFGTFKFDAKIHIKFIWILKCHISIVIRKYDITLKLWACLCELFYTCYWGELISGDGNYLENSTIFIWSY